MVSTADSHATSSKFDGTWPKPTPLFFFSCFYYSQLWRHCVFCLHLNSIRNVNCSTFADSLLNSLKMPHNSWHHIKGMGLTFKMQIMMENSTKNISIQTEFDNLPRSMMTFKSCVSHGKIWVNSLTPNTNDYLFLGSHCKQLVWKCEWKSDADKGTKTEPSTKFLWLHCLCSRKHVHALPCSEATLCSWQDVKEPALMNCMAVPQVSISVDQHLGHWATGFCFDPTLEVGFFLLLFFFYIDKRNNNKKFTQHQIWQMRY